MRPLRTLVAVGYPFAAFAALTWPPARGATVAVGVGVLLAAAIRRARGPGDALLASPLAPALGALLVAIPLLADVRHGDRVALLVPAVTNAVLMVAFARTLRPGPSMVETFARWQGYEIAGVRAGYCRAVTAVWCAFFAANGAVSLWLALRGTLAQWTLYTGVVAYALAGALGAAEITYRAWRFRDYRGRAADRLLQRIFPPRSPSS